MTNDPQPEADDVQTVGWNAIDEALNLVYGSQEPHHYGTIMRWSLGGRDPLDGISAYRCDDPTPHWHFVSYGLTELYDKHSDDAEYSGWGFELTFRLARSEGESEPPKWPMGLLQNMARYVFDSGNFFNAGDHMDLNSPIALETNTKITAAGFVIDEALGIIDTPHGKVAFLQIVGLTADELVAKISWDGDRFFELVSEQMPKFITRLDRDSLLDDPTAAQAVADGQAKDGSSTGVTYTNAIARERDGDKLIITIGAIAIENLRRVLPGRIPFDRTYDVYGYDTEKLLRFEPGDSANCQTLDDENDTTVITLTSDHAKVLASLLQPTAGDIPMPGFANTILRIIPTPIKNSEGEVTRTIG